MTATADRTTAAHMINAFRVVSVISIPLMGHFPSVRVYLLVFRVIIPSPSSLNRFHLPSGPQLVHRDGHCCNTCADIYPAARCCSPDVAHPGSAEGHECEARDVQGISGPS